jgi:hypothetical protein
MERTPSREEIERKAYEIYESRGCEDGHAEEDWLAAEQQLATEPSTSETSSRIKAAVAQAMQEKSASAGRRS